jgi:hypothetical protein
VKFERPQSKLSELRRQARFYFFADDLLLVPEAARLTGRKPLLRLSEQCGPMLCNGGVKVSINREEVQERLRKMSDEQLREFGLACVYMCSLKATCGKPPREAFVIQLEEARAEWKRRRESLERYTLLRFRCVVVNLIY